MACSSKVLPSIREEERDFFNEDVGCLLNSEEFYDRIPDPPIHLPRVRDSRQSSLKRGARLIYKRCKKCKHCGQLVKSLYYSTGCTFECTLAHLFRVDKPVYDAVWLDIQRSMGRLPMPAHGLPINRSFSSIQEYWKETFLKLYDKKDVRFTNLTKRLNTNTTTGGVDVGASIDAKLSELQPIPKVNKKE